MNSYLQHFEDLLAQVVQLRASDLHLSSGGSVFVRRYGKLAALDGEIWTEADVDQLVEQLLPVEQVQRFRDDRSLDLAHTSQAGPRFRLNLYYERQKPSLAARRIESEIPDFENLQLPSVLDRLTTVHDGLTLITGPTGSGKSTTLSAIVDRINRQSAQHILTIEDPVEYVHRNAQSMVHQRELHTDVPSFAQGIKDALREDPDVILVGEMRDQETMRTAIAAAETGHAVFSTLHTSDPVGALNRFLGAFSAEEQISLRHQLSMVLNAVVAQHLVPTQSGKARVPIVEVLWATNAVRNHIRTGRFEQIYTSMEAGSQEGMITRDQSLAHHVRSENITLDTAMRLAKEPKGLVELLRFQWSCETEESKPETNGFDRRTEAAPELNETTQTLNNPIV